MDYKKYPNIIGYSALILWALSAPLAVHIKNIPVFETLTIVFTISFLLSAAKLTYYNQWSQLKQPWFLWVIGFLGIYGNDVLYIAAFKHAPAAQADLINYLWPVFVILFTAFLPDEQLKPRHILSASLGLAGIYILVCHQNEGFNSKYILGYTLAFFDAVVWSVYTVVARRFGKSPVDIIGIYCGLGAICSLFLHGYIEPTVMPKINQWVVLLFMGMTTQCLAYFFWDFAVKRGDIKLLSILSYGNPVLSILFLILFGMAKPSMELAISCVLIAMAGLIGFMPWRKLYQQILDSLYLDFFLAKPTRDDRS